MALLKYQIALLIAGRMHGFNRSVTDIIKEVKVHENTVRKRLMEFGETPTSFLTLKEFMTVDLEEEQDPPCFRNSRKKDREKLNKLADPQVEQELEELELEIDRQLAERQAKTRGPWAKYAKENLLERKKEQEEASNSPVPKDIEEDQVEQFITEETLGVIQNCLVPAENVPVETTSGSKTEESVLMPPPDSTYLQLRHHLRPSMASLGIEDTVVDCKKIETEAAEGSEATEELDLTGIDEDEMETYLLTDAEASAKASMWMTLNGEFLKELEEKRKRKEEEEEEKQRRGEKRKRKHRKPRQSYNANTPGEAIEKMLLEKRISSKINYDVLKNLNNLGKNLGSTSEASAAPPTAVESKPIISSPRRTLQPNASRSIATVKREDAKKTQEATPAPAPPPAPVLTEEEDEEEDEEEYNTADVSEMSAADLLNRFGQDDYGNEEDYY